MTERQLIGVSRNSTTHQLSRILNFQKTLFVVETKITLSEEEETKKIAYFISEQVERMVSLPIIGVKIDLAPHYF